MFHKQIQTNVHNKICTSNIGWTTMKKDGIFVMKYLIFSTSDTEWTTR